MAHFRLERYARAERAEATYGRLLHVPTARSTVGTYVCHTLEDIERQPASWTTVWVGGAPRLPWKVPGATAIPRGRYTVTITPSARFQRDLPLVVGVPGFSGVRFHAGNVTTDTDGCILVGLAPNRPESAAAWLGRSREALALVLVAFADGPHTLEIVRTYPVGPVARPA